jgi:threonine aldolase
MRRPTTPTIAPRAEARLGEIFERRVSAFPVAAGTAADALALAASPPQFLAKSWRAEAS